jgi:hypothetical protein
MATIFSNTLQQAAAKIARAPLSTRLQLATEFYNTVNKLPKYKGAKDATEAVDRGEITNGSLYRDDTQGLLISVAKGSGKKVIIKNPVEKA